MYIQVSYLYIYKYHKYIYTNIIRIYIRVSADLELHSGEDADGREDHEGEEKHEQRVHHHVDRHHLFSFSLRLVILLISHKSATFRGGAATFAGGWPE